MRILIVEDSVTMRRVMEMTFAGEDAELLAVESGELALQHGRDFGPDVAFIDASLPGIDGYEVTRAMKSDPQLAGTSVILMASQHRPLDEARASEVGADGHILKPFDTQDAINKATELTGQDEAFYDAPSIPVARSATAPPTARPATTPPSPVAQPSYRPTPPPLPLNGPSSRPMAPTPMSTGTPLTGAHVAVASTYPSQPVAAVVASTPMQTQATAAVDEALSHSVVERLETLGLTPDQVEGVLKLSAEVVERVVWEVVPELAEAMIREELHRLVGD
ncbi:MAG: response regulator [Myxococcales bacterium]|jgi:CheY-like chemotaxis protein|nr:response regulator [Myxococcales bacterium]